MGKSLLIADALVSALAQYGFEPRSVVPAPGSNLQDPVGWKPDVALLEIDPDDKAAGMELIGVFRRTGVAVAAMISDIDSNLHDECVDAGASAVINTRSALTNLIEVIARLTAGDIVTAAQTTQSERAKRARQAPFAVLTAREKSVLAALMDGRRAESIAKNDLVSISTVRSQIKAILQKLGVNCQLAAVAMARGVGWEGDVADPASHEPASIGTDTGGHRAP